MKKENVFDDYLVMIENSWTYKKLTEKEKENLKNIFYSIRTENALKGTYKQRRAVLDAIYFAFLKGLNYEPIGWRENEENYLKF